MPSSVLITTGIHTCHSFLHPIEFNHLVARYGTAEFPIYHNDECVVWPNGESVHPVYRTTVKVSIASPHITSHGTIIDPTLLLQL
jgi:hypothetical protein